MRALRSGIQAGTSARPGTGPWTPAFAGVTAFCRPTASPNRSRGRWEKRWRGTRVPISATPQHSGGRGRCRHEPVVGEGGQPPAGESRGLAQPVSRRPSPAGARLGGQPPLAPTPPSAAGRFRWRMHRAPPSFQRRPTAGEGAGLRPAPRPGGARHRDGIEAVRRGGDLARGTPGKPVVLDAIDEEGWGARQPSSPTH